jgi:hypothetical protein
VAKVVQPDGRQPGGLHQTFEEVGHLPGGGLEGCSPPPGWWWVRTRTAAG